MKIESKTEVIDLSHQMPTFTETVAGVPAFLAKLWRLVDDPDTNNLICWSKDGRSFIIQNQAQFARELLPLNYKHNNMASFIRQLNMYGFHKITSIDNGGLKFDRDEMEFSHPCFKRESPYLLEHIKRKIANTKALDEKSGKTEAVSKMLQDIKAMRGRQDSLDSRFSVMKQENEALWREIASLRQKHSKQQQIVNKLIQFLITIVQPSRNMSSVRRHMQLMINDTPENGKMRSDSESESIGGPVIHELGEELLEEVGIDDDELLDPGSPYISHTDPGNASPLNIERPQSSTSQFSNNYGEISNQSFDDVAGIEELRRNIKKEINAHNSEASTTNASSVDAPPLPAFFATMSPGGSQVIYHVTEAPETTETTSTFSENNVLTTPMVRQEMARKNKQRRKRTSAEDINSQAATSTKVSKPSQQTIQQQLQQRRLLQQQEKVQKQSEQQTQKMNIKEEIDPMIFLNVYPDNQLLSDASLISPNISEDSRQSNSISGCSRTNPLIRETRSETNVTPDLFNPNDIATDIPADIFEDSSLISSDKNSSSNNLKFNQQQQFGRTFDGNFSSYIPSSNNNVNGNATNIAPNTASTSTAAPQSSSSTAANENNDAAPSTSTQNKTGSMALTKFKNNPVHHDDMREDVNVHLDFMQDELDSLKDLLRSDSYSLDANTLLGLFNDSDLLGPYGLQMSGDIPNTSNEKKGSELAPYQNMYDLSDMMYMNNKNDLEENTESENNSRQLQLPSSELNTPRHE